MAKIAPRFGDVRVLGPHGFLRVGYTDWGPADAPLPIVCVHGLTRNSRDFDPLAQRLAERGRRVVALDLPGRGRSEFAHRPADYGTPLYLAATSAVIARLGVEQVDWVGTSLGGHVGMEMAARANAPIRRLVLNDFGARVPVAALQRIAGYLRRARVFADIEQVERYLRDVHAPFGALTDAQWRHLAVNSVIQDPAGLRLHYDPAIVEQFSRPMLLDVVLWRVWEQVSCPVLVVRGQESDLLLPSTVAEMKRRGKAAALGRVEFLEIAGCGHAPALMANEQIDVVERFLSADDAAMSQRRVRT